MDATPSSLSRWLAYSLVLAFGVVLIRTAWVSDDAYITFRTVDNVINGFGPRWNVAERVQAYTHPLWMWLHVAVASVVGNIYFSSLAISIVLSLSAVLLVAVRAAAPWQAVVAIVTLGSSRAFVDYSSSGLENPLSHLLIGTFVVALVDGVAAKRPWLPAFIASLILLNRQDLVWIIGPCLLWLMATEQGARRLRALAIGFSPLVLWELFSLLYYGFFVPNTAFAKLQTGVAPVALITQGMHYVEESFRHDPLTLTIIVVSIVTGIVRRGVWRALAVGQCLHAAYVVWSGGDFMSGRHFSVSFFSGVLALASVPVKVGRPGATVAAAVIAGANVLVTTPNVLSGPRFGLYAAYAEFHGIADERRYYYPRTGLLRWRAGLTPPALNEGVVARAMLAAGQTVATRDAVGMFGFAAGPELYIVDRFALTDPLLARLPADPSSRIGHFQRELPEGYIQSLRTGVNQIEDPEIAALYDQLRLITRGPLWSRERLVAIVAANSGRLIPD